MKLSTRFKIIQSVALASLAVLALGLFQTQVIRGSYYRMMSENNRIRLIRLEAPRGNIYDRNGVLLATNRPTYNVHVIPEDFDPTDLPTLSKFLDLTEEEIRRRTSQVRYASFTPVLLARDISKEVAMKIEESRPRLNGVFIQVQAMRSYPLGDLGAHIVGYIGKISRSEYERSDRSVYHFNSWIGRTGMERAYDSLLRGEDGGRQLEVDARGVPIRQLSEKKPRPGNDLHLSIDAKFQSRVRRILGDHQGAVMVMDLDTGEMLVALSAPEFDPNVFVMPKRSKDRVALIGSNERPLFDRGFKGLYPPGSIFKLVTAMAALEMGRITPHTTFNCPGYFKFNSRSRKFKCWFHEGHGRVDLYTALERSCNVYFYQAGRLVGNNAIANYARQLGFGSGLGLDVPTSAGLVPDAVWKKKKYKEKWYPGETISLAIGQSYLLVSPIQILRLIAAVASDGQAPQPDLTHQRVPNPVKTGKHLKIQKETFRVLRQGMLQAVSSDRGTAQMARVNFGKLAAKTGTAQAPPGKPHAWFGGFYPFKDPEIAIVIFVERGVSGGMTGGKLAKQVVRAWNDLYVTAIS